MMRFEFATATQIIFGAGTINEIGGIAANFGKRALVVTGCAQTYVTPMLKVLAWKNIETVCFSVCEEPTTELVRRGVQEATANQCDFIIGFGGGSALDTGKAIAALLANGGDLLNYLEVIGSGKSLTKRAAPFIAIPTTAGTGTEVTRNAVLKSPEHHVKVSLRSALMLPHVALVDPELTYTLPPEITASTGLDAFTQVIEPFVCNAPNPMTDAICREGIRRVARSLRQACEHGNDAAAREDMAVASLFGGLALANAKLGAVHGFAAPIGGMFPAPHGAVCARLLPIVIDINVRALRERFPQSESLERYHEIARILTESDVALAEDGVEWIQELCNALDVPPLSAYNMRREDIPGLVEQAAKASSMKGNPITLMAEEMQEILMQAL